MCVCVRVCVSLCVCFAVRRSHRLQVIQEGDNRLTTTELKTDRRSGPGRRVSITREPVNVMYVFLIRPGAEITDWHITAPRPQALKLPDHPTTENRREDDEE